MKAHVTSACFVTRPRVSCLCRQIQTQIIVTLPAPFITFNIVIKSSQSLLFHFYCAVYHVLSVNVTRFMFLIESLNAKHSKNSKYLPSRNIMTCVFDVVL